jgi:Domain of Unknown Function (DUF1080)
MKSLHACCWAVFALALSWAAATSLAQEKKTENKEKLAFTDPAKAGTDFTIQGEYAGEIKHDDETVKFGVQVIALGDGKFRAVAYKGGLPGDGWDKEKCHTAEGELKDGVATFSGDNGSGTIKDGVLSVMNKDGKAIADLKKVERKSSTMGAKPPKGAVVLFDGTSTDAFNGGRITDDKLLMQGVTSKQKFGDYSIHAEFQLPYMPFARGQGRANSGCYLQGRYEVQILDSFGLEGKNNECGGIYGIRDPDVNMCFPPLAWQTYDIDYTAAKYDAAGKKTANAHMTVKHNGVVVHDNAEVPKTTTAAPVQEGPEPGPVYLQDHGNPVRFRNIWVVEKK